MNKAHAELPKGEISRVEKDGRCLGLRMNGVFHQAMHPETLGQRLDPVRWVQNTAPNADGRLPAAHPVQAVEVYKPGVLQVDTDTPLFCQPGDLVSRDADNCFGVIGTAQRWTYHPVNVPKGAPRHVIEKEAGKLVDRMAHLRQIAERRAGEKQAELFTIREDDKGRGEIVSTLPDGREKRWRLFATEGAAHSFLERDGEREKLKTMHEQAARSVESTKKVAKALLSDRADGFSR